MIAWLLAGCAYKVALSSVPTPVEVVLPDGRVVVTPVEVDLRWAPFGHQPIVARAVGYRPLELDLRRDEIRLGRLVGTTLGHPSTLWGRPRGEIRLLLVREHGPAGTWDPADLP